MEAKLQFYIVTLRNGSVQWDKFIEARSPEQATTFVLKQYTRVYKVVSVVLASPELSPPE